MQWLFYQQVIYQWILLMNTVDEYTSMNILITEWSWWLIHQWNNNIIIASVVELKIIINHIHYYSCISILMLQHLEWNKYQSMNTVNECFQRIYQSLDDSGDWSVNEILILVYLPYVSQLRAMCLPVHLWRKNVYTYNNDWVHCLKRKAERKPWPIWGSWSRT